MTLRLAAVAMGLFLWAPSSAAAVPLHASKVVSSSCPQSTEATFQIRLSVPPESAPDRSTLMSVVSSANYLRGEWLAAHLDFFDAAGGAISTHPFSAGEIRLMNDRTSISERGHYPFLEFPVQIPERGGPVTIRLTVRLHADEGRECEVVFQRIIRHIPGVPPRPELFTAKLHKGGIGEGPSETGELVLGARCERIAAGVRVVVAHGGDSHVLRAPRHCFAGQWASWGSWTRPGDVVPGLRFPSTGPLAGPNALVIVPVGRPSTRVYRVDVVWHRRLLLRRRMTVTVLRRRAARRIYRDANKGSFIRCRHVLEDPSQPASRDTEGRQYCLVPPNSDTDVRFSRW